MDYGWFYDSLIAPPRYTEVISFGFPLRLGIQKHFSPISTSSRVASGLIDLLRFDNKGISTFFLLDAPSIPGLSGGPVFSVPSYLDPRDSLKLIGLVHGVISDNTGGKFAAIVPSYYILKTIVKSPRFSGIKKIYHKNGKLWSERKYEDGYLVEILSNYNSKGKQQDKGTLKNGTGTVKIYDENDQLILIDYWENKKFIKRDLQN